MVLVLRVDNLVVDIPVLGFSLESLQVFCICNCIFILIFFADHVLCLCNKMVGYVLVMWQCLVLDQYKL